MSAQLGIGAAGAFLIFATLILVQVGSDWNPIQDDLIEETSTDSLSSWDDTVQVPSDILAARTAERLLFFGSGRGALSISLGLDELTALLNEILPGLLPVGVEQARLSMSHGVAAVHARIVTRYWVGTSTLGSLFSVMPDTINAELKGILSGTGRRLTLEVIGARAQGISLPAAVVDVLIEQLPMRTNAVGDRGLEFILPKEIAGVHVTGDKVILVLAGSILDRTDDD